MDISDIGTSRPSVSHHGEVGRTRRMRRLALAAASLLLAGCGHRLTLTLAATFTAQRPLPPGSVDIPPTLAGCPPPPSHLPPPPPPWHPKVLIPDAQLPRPQTPKPWTSDVTASAGKGMWVWQWTSTEHGDAHAIVARAQAAGLHQLWVRVGDSPDGFYGGATLTAIVDLAHAAGLRVIAWGFPYLYDPVRDAGWTAQILAWRSGSGQQVDGYSADLERSTEGVAMSALRAGVYLDQVRRVAGDRLVVATVYPPLDTYWNGGYPYAAMAPYVDAFAPMEYWECVDPGLDARQALARLGALRPVHLIGQAFTMADSGGRQPPPSPAEINRFLGVGQRAGAVGVSFWVWQTASSDEWDALAAYPWAPPA